MISPKQKECPKCKKPIPKTWSNHFECGWSAENSRDTRRDSSVSPIPKSETDKMMRESVNEVCSIFDMPLQELKDDIEKYSSMINTIFISKRNEK